MPRFSPYAWSTVGGRFAPQYQSFSAVSGYPANGHWSRFRQSAAEWPQLGLCRPTASGPKTWQAIIERLAPIPLAALMAPELTLQRGCWLRQYRPRSFRSRFLRCSHLTGCPLYTRCLKCRATVYVRSARQPNSSRYFLEFNLDLLQMVRR